MKRWTLARLGLFLASLVCVVGCAGQSARTDILAPAVVQAFPGVAQDAERGIAADEAAGEAPASIKLRRERLARFGDGIQRLQVRP